MNWRKHFRAWPRASRAGLSRSNGLLISTEGPVIHFACPMRWRNSRMPWKRRAEKKEPPKKTKNLVGESREEKRTAPKNRNLGGKPGLKPTSGLRRPGKW